MSNRSCDVDKTIHAVLEIIVSRRVHNIGMRGLRREKGDRWTGEGPRCGCWEGSRKDSTNGNFRELRKDIGTYVWWNFGGILKKLERNRKKNLEGNSGEIKSLWEKHTRIGNAIVTVLDLTELWSHWWNCWEIQENLRKSWKIGGKLKTWQKHARKLNLLKKLKIFEWKSWS